MADEEQLEILKASVMEDNDCKAWNKWRKYNAPRSMIFLQGAKLQGANLQGVDLQDAYLEGANLEGTDLGGADLQNAKLAKANLQNADLQRANLENTYLLGANLQRANLREANLREAKLQGANLQGAKLQGAYLKGAYLLKTVLDGALVYKADIIEQKIKVQTAKGIRCTHLELGRKPGDKTLRCESQEQLQELEDCLENWKLTLEDLYEKRTKEDVTRPYNSGL